MFKKRRDTAPELEVKQETDPLFSFLDNQDREVHITQEMAHLYIGQGTNVRMWNTCLQPEQPRVQIDLAPVEAGERDEEQQQSQLIVDKAIQINTDYKLGSFDKIKDLDLNELPMLPATILQGIRDGLRHMSPGINKE